MRPVIEASAPGKLVIVGEYAVLHGAPGISVAVDVCALARLESRPGRDSELVIPDTGERFRFHAGYGRCACAGRHPSPGALGLPLESCIATLIAHGLLPHPGALPACRIELDTAAFHSRDAAGQRIKLGLGSSAAITVALMGALLQFLRAAPLSSDKLGALCLEAHRRLQGGSGSGIDVATALAGGVISIDGALAMPRDRVQLHCPGPRICTCLPSGPAAAPRHPPCWAGCRTTVSSSRRPVRDHMAAAWRDRRTNGISLARERRPALFWYRWTATHQRCAIWIGMQVSVSTAAGTRPCARSPWHMARSTSRPAQAVEILASR